MAWIWPSLVGDKNAIILQPFKLHFSIDCSSKMRYCVTFYLNWLRNYERSKLELPNSLNKKHTLNFNLIYRIGANWAPLLIRPPPQEKSNRPPVKNRYWNNRTPSQIDPHPTSFYLRWHKEQAWIGLKMRKTCNAHATMHMQQCTCNNLHPTMHMHVDVDDILFLWSQNGRGQNWI